MTSPYVGARVMGKWAVGGEQGGGAEREGKWSVAEVLERYAVLLQRHPDTFHESICILLLIGLCELQVADRVAVLLGNRGAKWSNPLSLILGNAASKLKFVVHRLALDGGCLRWL